MNAGELANISGIIREYLHRIDEVGDRDNIGHVQKAALKSPIYTELFKYLKKSTKVFIYSIPVS